MINLIYTNIHTFNFGQMKTAKSIFIREVK